MCFLCFILSFCIFIDQNNIFECTGFLIEIKGWHGFLLFNSFNPLVSGLKIKIRRAKTFQRQVVILSKNLFKVDLFFDQQLIESLFAILYDPELEWLWWRFRQIIRFKGFLKNEKRVTLGDSLLGLLSSPLFFLDKYRYLAKSCALMGGF